jgi:Tol biopolymer transport system component
MLIIWLLLALQGLTNAWSQEPSVLKETTIRDSAAYLGQTPPGETPVVFAPGIVSLDGRLETYPTFSPDGKEMFFSVVDAVWTEGGIFHTRVKDGIWTKPERASFSSSQSINWESFTSPDGKRMFFASSRLPSSASDTDIWVIERVSDTTWSNPVRLGNPVNSDANDGSACVTNKGTLYFHSNRGGGIGGSEMYRSALSGNTYSQVENPGSIIRTGQKEAELYMAPDESYLIFISQTRAGGKGGWDLWICFRNWEGSWTPPTTMGPEINTPNDEYGPRVTHDGKFLFFTRENRGKTMDIY